MIRYKVKKNFVKMFPVSWRDTGITIGILAGVYLVCAIIHYFSPGFRNDAMLFFLAIVLIARSTEGYFYDVAASFLSVICVNFAFTYPYNDLNFTISGYPLAFMVMLFTSLSVSTLTSRAKQQDKMREQVTKERIYSNLLRSVSHDIRTPLTSIAGSASALMDSKEKLSDEQKEELLCGIYEEAQWLVRVVENILSITRMGGENSHISKTPELPEEIISSAVARIGKVYPKEKIQIRLPEDYFFVPMDPILIEQVIFNVLENAVLHAKDHTCITISLYKTGNTVTFEISDDGCSAAGKSGLSFGAMFDSDSSGEKNVKRNMGIGLAVCKSIILAHGGTLDADISRKGTVISFTLPM